MISNQCLSSHFKNLILDANSSSQMSLDQNIYFEDIIYYITLKSYRADWKWRHINFRCVYIMMELHCALLLYDDVFKNNT